MQHTSSVVVIVLLVLFGLYRRTRRTIGFQKFVKRRTITRMALLAVVGVLVLVIGFLHPMVYIFDAIGIVLGGIIAYYAIRTTSFEWRQGAWFYRPNPWIGVLLVVLFIGRIAYRVYQDYAMFGATASANGRSAAQAQWTVYSHEPFTAIILFTLITYYVAYYTFLIRRERHLEAKGEGSGSDFENV
jgi:hypothetical protein